MFRMASSPRVWRKQRGWLTCPGITPRWAGCHPHSHYITISRTTYPPSHGKQLHHLKHDQPGDLIPTHAGKTVRRRRTLRFRRAHPRSRGENGKVRHSDQIRYGPPPLTRGKRTRNRVRELVPGLIPAHAGKTTPPPNAPEFQWAHPHSRGENYAGASEVFRRNGSSPLTRGKPSTTATRQSPERAHPRSRGENDPVVVGGVAAAGSSPLTRGKRAGRWWSWVWVRLIPAHAGKTLVALSPVTVVWAHPRSRGENRAVRGFTRAVSGSSPLTRGKLAADRE